MKKLLASLVAVFALLPAQAASADTLNLSAGVFPQDELAALSSTGDPFAVGGGTAGITQFAFSAHCKSAGGCPPNSATASGYAVVSDAASGEDQGHVCEYLPINTNPDAAEFWVIVEKGSGYFGSFPVLDFIASDFGDEPPNGSPDNLIISGAPFCGTSFGGFTGGPVVQGNVVVKNG
jgi:hypothetical protein